MKLQDCALKLVERVARVEVKKLNSGDQFFCLGIYHQPVRPRRK